MKKALILNISYLIIIFISGAQNSKLIGTWRGTFNEYFHGDTDVEIKIDYIDNDWQVRLKRRMHRYSYDQNWNCYDIEQKGDTLKWYYKLSTKYERGQKNKNDKELSFSISKVAARVIYKGGVLHYISFDWENTIDYGFDGEVINQYESPTTNQAYIHETILYKIEDK